jgi:competence protein ComGC
MSLRTIRELFRHLWKKDRWFLIPFIVVLLVISIVLIITSGAAYVAPFVYSIF